MGELRKGKKQGGSISASISASNIAVVVVVVIIIIMPQHVLFKHQKKVRLILQIISPRAGTATNLFGA